MGSVFKTLSLQKVSMVLMVEMKWYNKYRRKYFEEEVLPEIRAFRKVIATQAMAKRKMLMKQCQKPKPESEEPSAVTATVILNEFPFDEEVPF